MPGIGPAAGAIAGGIATFFTATSPLFIAARLVTAVAISSLISRKLAGYDPGMQARAITARDTVAPQLKVYGTTLVSGPLMWNDVSGTNNRLLWSAIPLAGHEVEAITDVWLDDVQITNSQIGGGAAGGGAVTAGTFAPKDGKDVVTIYKHLGTSTQTADANLVAEFAGWTSDHRARGIANIVCRFDYFKESEAVWNGREPTNIRAMVQGAKVYDPRQDTTQPGVIIGAQDRDDPTTWTWSDNPALCAIDYLRDSKFGMGLDESRIDWPAVMDAATYCATNVSIPGGSEDRYSCNGTVSGTETHRANLENILSSCNGEITVSGGLWTIRVAEYQAPTQSYGADDVLEAIGIHANLERSERVNTLKAQFIDPEDNHKLVESPPVTATALTDRDNGQILEDEIILPMTNSFYMAQRIAWVHLHILDQEKSVTTKLNLKAGASSVGERINLTVDELAWSPKVFRLMNWSLQEGDELGIAVELREDSPTAYLDPAVGNYTTRNAAGVLTLGDPLNQFDQVNNFDDATVLGFNPSFSDWITIANGAGPAGWDRWSSPNNYVREEDDLLTPPYALRFDNIPTGDNQGFLRETNLEFSIDAVMVGSMDVKIVAAGTVETGSPGLLIDIQQNNLANSYYRRYVKADTSKVGVWQRVHFKLSARDYDVAGNGPTLVSDFDTIRIYIMGSWNVWPGARFDGQVIFDNFRFTIVDPQLENDQQTWSPISGTTDAPDDNATVGAIAGTNLESLYSVPSTEGGGQVIAEANAEESTTSTSYVLKKKFQLQGTGQVQIYFDHRAVGATVANGTIRAVQGVTQVGLANLGLSGSYIAESFTVTLDNADDELEIEILTLSGQTLYIRNVEVRALTADGSSTTLD